ncbi:MAG: amidohydrolase family protein [Steroidobacteraceae bacterium]
MTDIAQPVTIIDSHVHFWRIGGPGQTWPGPDLQALYRDFGPPELREALCTAAAAVAPDSNSTAQVQSVVLVQSQPDDRDTDWLLGLAATLPLVAAVVGWVDLASPSAPARIGELAREPKLRGLRPMLQAIEDTQWLLRAELEPALHAMAQHGLRFDALIQPRHLPMLLEFARRWPKLPIVIDHGAKPRIALGEIEPWQAQLAELSFCPNVYCKLSGLRTEQAAGAPSAELEPYMRCLMTSFQDRLMWGSDWPVLLESGDRYSEWLQTAMRAALTHGTASGRPALQSLFREAASRFYGLS